MGKLLAIIPLALVMAGPTALASESPATFAEAKALSARLDKPILIDFYTEWCMPCKQFDKDAKEDADLIKGLESIVLFKVDAEKGDGVQLAKEFSAYFYPTFVVANSMGETIDRWSGYRGKAFLKRFEDALSDLTTIDEKKTRYVSRPTVKDAAILGEYHSDVGDYREAVAYYTEAQNMNEDESRDYPYHIFMNTADGATTDKSFTFDDVLKAADDAFAVKNLHPNNAISFVEKLLSLAKKNNRVDDIAPYLLAGIEATADSTQPYYNQYIQRMHNELKSKYVLLIEKDEARAVEYKRTTMPEGWMDDAGQLNDFAWWCFENMVNLEEADELSAKSVEMADDGKQKANFLDTLAEIKNAAGDTKAAISLIRRAIAEDPEKEHYKKQLARFEQITESGGQ